MKGRAIAFLRSLLFPPVQFFVWDSLICACATYIIRVQMESCDPKVPAHAQGVHQSQPLLNQPLSNSGSSSSRPGVVEFARVPNSSGNSGESHYADLERMKSQISDWLTDVERRGNKMFEWRNPGSPQG